MLWNLYSWINMKMRIWEKIRDFFYLIIFFHWNSHFRLSSETCQTLTQSDHSNQVKLSHRCYSLWNLRIASKRERHLRSENFANYIVRAETLNPSSFQNSQNFPAKFETALSLLFLALFVDLPRIYSFQTHCHFSHANYNQRKFPKPCSITNASLQISYSLTVSGHIIAHQEIRKFSSSSPLPSHCI